RHGSRRLPQHAVTRLRHAHQTESLVDEVLPVVLVTALAGRRRCRQDAGGRLLAQQLDPDRKQNVRHQPASRMPKQPLGTSAADAWAQLPAADRSGLAGLPLQESLAEAESDL